MRADVIVLFQLGFDDGLNLSDLTRIPQMNW